MASVRWQTPFLPCDKEKKAGKGGKRLEKVKMAKMAKYMLLLCKKALMCTTEKAERVLKRQKRRKVWQGPIINKLKFMLRNATARQFCPFPCPPHRHYCWQISIWKIVSKMKNEMRKKKKNTCFTCWWWWHGDMVWLKVLSLLSLCCQMAYSE